MTNTQPITRPPTKQGDPTPAQTVKRLVCFLAFGLSLLAQTPTPTLTLTGPATIRPGAPVTLTLTLSGSTGANLASFQATVGLPAGFAVTSSAIGAAGTAAAKTLTCAPTLPGPCVVVGLNQTNLADGVVFTLTGIAARPGALSFPLSASLAASSAATAEGVALASGAAFSLTVLSACDINGDGKVDIADVLAYLNSYVFGAVTPIVDLNGDGLANIIDVQRIATAGLGGACVTGP